MSRYEIGPDATVEGTPTVLVLVAGQRDRHLLATELGDTYEVTVGPPDDDWGAFDCVVVDDRTLPAVVDELAAHRTAAEPVFLPVLVLAGSEDRAERLLTSPAADHVDDVVVAPTRGPLLRTRMTALLRTRALSLELDDERDQYKTLAQSAQDVILVFDEDGVVQYANPAVEAVFGYAPAAVVDGAITDLFVDEDLPTLAVAGTAGEPVVGRHADGDPFPTEVSVAAFERDDERRYTAIVRDVSEREAREREIARSHDLLEQTQSIADVGGWEVNLETGALTWTDEAYRIHGVPVGTEVTLEDAIELFHPDDVVVIREAIEQPLSPGEQFDLDFRLQHPDGEERWIRGVGQAIEENGTHLIRGAVQDITDRVERERQLERTVDLLDETQQIANVGGWEIDLSTGELTGTREAYEIYGLPTDASLDYQNVIESYHPDDAADAFSAISSASTTDEPIDIELRLVVDSETRWVRVKGNTAEAEGEEVVRGTVQDITERKLREQELERSHAMLDQTQTIATIGGWELDVESGDLLFTDETYRIHDVPVGAHVDLEAAFGFYHPEDEPSVRAAVERAIEDGVPYDLECRLVTAAERERWVRIQGLPEGAHGEGVIRGTIQDITEQKEQARELERSEGRFRAVFERATDAMVIANDDGEYVMANPAATELFGVEESELLGRTIAEFAPEDYDFGREWERFHRGEHVTGEFPLVRPDGTRIMTQFVATPNILPGRHLSALRDVTDLHQREQRLSVLDRVLRHNIRNRLNVAMGHATTLAGDDNATVRASAATIVDACEELLDLSETARRFETAIHPFGSVNERLDLAAHLPHVVEEVETSYPEAAIDLDLDGDEALCVDAHEALELAIEEVVENAIIHCDRTPEVDISARARPNGTVELRVSDNGPGLCEVERDALDRGIETPLEHMSGLGLWFVRWTVESSGGSLAVEDNDPRGTVVVLRLPRGSAHR